MLPGIAAYSTYGGELADYEPVEDPTTDLSAAADDEARADLSAMTGTAVRAFVAFTVSGGVCTVASHYAVWGGGLSVKPTVVRNSAGNFTVTWPATITDARGNSQGVSLRRGWGNVEPGANVFVAPVEIPTPNTALVVTSRSSTEAAADPGTQAVVVFVV